MKNIFWTGYSNDERHSALNKIRNVISNYGDIVDVHLFSDISINFTIEIEEFKIDPLYHDLTKIIEVQNSEKFNSNSEKERTVYLNVTFIKGTGDHKIEVPAVPG